MGYGGLTSKDKLVTGQELASDNKRMLCQPANATLAVQV
jgi:hypothetical protein